MDSLNKSEELARAHYEDLKMQLDIQIQPLADFFDLSTSEINTNKLPVLNYKPEYHDNPLAGGHSLRLYSTLTVQELWDRIKE